MNVAEIVASYQRSNRRIIFLDYDGTLVGFRKDPSKARPPTILKQRLLELARQPTNSIVVISGRDRPTLETWLGDLPIGLAAEHGFWYKHQGATWQTAPAPTPGWKSSVRRIMSRYANGSDGAWIEEKANAFAWHSRRMANETNAARLQKELISELTPLAGRLKLRVLSGKRIVDVYPLAFSKGTVAKRWLEAPKYDFILAAGDDITDEELFKAMPAHSFTVKIGPGDTHASLRLPSYIAMRRLLAALAKTDH